jgi:hypothetical protein
VSRNSVRVLNLGNSIGNSQFGGDNKDIKFIDSFFFYLQDKNIYFTETDKDSVVFAAMKIKEVKDTSQTGIPGCFEVSDKVVKWSLCETEPEEADKWICAIKPFIGLKCDTEEGV